MITSEMFIAINTVPYKNYISTPEVKL